LRVVVVSKLRSTSLTVTGEWAGVDVMTAR